MEYRWLKVCDLSAGVRQVMINRPEALNALDAELLGELGKCFDELRTDSTVRAVLLTGVGKAFVAGADIKAMAPMNVREGQDFGELGAQTFRKLEQLPMPVIAVVNGYALGGGCELAMACDVRIASEKAVFGQPEVGLGICPGFGGTQRLPRIVGTGVAAELLFTARNVRAEEALRIGLVNAVYAPDALEAEALKMAETIASKAPLAVRAAKRAMHRGLQADIDTGLAFESAEFGGCFASEDQKEGMKAFLSKSKTEFKAR